MSEQRRVQPDFDDVEGHLKKRGAEAETAEGEDAAGHGFRFPADAATAEGDDTEGHRIREGDAEAAEGDDVEGHMQVPERDELNHQRLR